MNLKKIIFNPYFLYCISFTVILAVYLLEWSDLNPALSTGTLVFLLTSIVVLLFAGYVFMKHRVNLEVPGKPYTGTGRYINSFIIVGIIVEAIYSGGLPIFGTGRFSYSDFGVPTFHVLLLTISYYVALVNWELILTDRLSKKNAGSFLVALLPFVVSINRGMLVMLFLSCFFLYVHYKGVYLSLKTVIALAVAALFFLYAFGLFGNYRLHKDYHWEEPMTNSDLIMCIGGATEEFEDSVIPNEFFWTFTYVSSPMANLQTAVDHRPADQKVGIKDVLDYTLDLFMPDFISKRLNVTEVKQYQITDELTVGTAYYTAFLRLGWAGMIIYLVVLLIYPIIWLYLTEKFAPQYVNISTAILCTIFVLSFFTNFLSYTGLVVLLVFPFILEMISKANARRF